MQSDTLKAVDAENPSEVAKRLAGYSRATRESWTHLLTGARVDGYARQQYLSGYASAVIDFGAEAAHYATLDSATRKQIVRQFVDAEYGEGISVNIEVRRMGEDDLKDAAASYESGVALSYILNYGTISKDDDRYVDPDDSLKVADTVEKAVRPFQSEYGYRLDEIRDLAETHSIDSSELVRLVEGEEGVEGFLDLFSDPNARSQVSDQIQRLNASKIIINNIDILARQAFPQPDETDS
jgi:hypothetical protein